MNPKDEMVPQEGSEGSSSPVDPSTKKNPVSVNVTKGEFHASSFSGPIPPPWILKGYEEVFPGCAERILAMAEKQSSHRQVLEKDRLSATNRTEHWGQIFAFVIALTSILGGIYLISIGKDASGLTAIIAALGALVGAFIYGKYTQAQERRQKLKPFEERETQDDSQPKLPAA